MKKTYTLILKSFQLPENIASFFNNKLINVNYECIWENQSGEVLPTNIKLNYVSQDPHFDDEKNNVKNIWKIGELPKSIEDVLVSGLDKHALSVPDRPYFLD